MIKLPPPHLLPGLSWSPLTGFWAHTRPLHSLLHKVAAVEIRPSHPEMGTLHWLPLPLRRTLRSWSPRPCKAAVFFETSLLPHASPLFPCRQTDTGAFLLLLKSTKHTPSSGLGICQPASGDALSPDSCMMDPLLYRLMGCFHWNLSSRQEAPAGPPATLAAPAMHSA